MSCAKIVACSFVMFVIGVGVGLGVGYGVFYKKAESTNQTSATNNSTRSSPGTTTTTTSTTRSAATTTTTRALVTPASPSTTSTSTSEPAIVPVGACPPVLPNPYTTRHLAEVNQSTVTTDFQRFFYAFVAPAGVSQAMIAFHFTTDWGSWYLDDVTVQSPANPSRNLIDNGAFESGNLGSQWKFCDTRFSWLTGGSVVSHTHNFGSYAYESQAVSDGSNEYLTQMFNVEGLREYDVQFYLSMNGAGGSAAVSIMMH